MSENEQYMPVIEQGGPTEGELFGLETLKYTLENKKIPKSLAKLLWAYNPKDASLANLKRVDMERVLSGFEYCKELTELIQVNPKALSYDVEKGKKRKDIIGMIKEQIDEDVGKTGAEDNLFMRLTRADDALNLKLISPRAIPPANLQQRVARTPSVGEKIGSKLFGKNKSEKEPEHGPVG